MPIQSDNPKSSRRLARQTNRTNKIQSVAKRDPRSLMAVSEVASQHNAEHKNMFLMQQTIHVCQSLMTYSPSIELGLLISLVLPSTCSGVVVSSSHKKECRKAKLHSEPRRYVIDPITHQAFVKLQRSL